MKFQNLVQVLSTLEILRGLKHSGKTNVEVDTDLLKSSEYLSSPDSFYISLLQIQKKKNQNKPNNPLTCAQLCEQKNHILELKSAREKCPDKFKALIV